MVITSQLNVKVSNLLHGALKAHIVFRLQIIEVRNLHLSVRKSDIYVHDIMILYKKTYSRPAVVVNGLISYCVLLC